MSIWKDHKQTSEKRVKQSVMIHLLNKNKQKITYGYIDKYFSEQNHQKSFKGYKNFFTKNDYTQVSTLEI